MIAPPAALAPADRVDTGVAGLDEILAGGYPIRRVVLVTGGVGTGKTTLVTQFLMAGIRRGEPGVLVSVDTKPRHVVDDARGFGWDLQDAISRNLLVVLDASPYFTALRGNKEPDARLVAGDLTRHVLGGKALRLGIDSLSALLPSDGEPALAREFVRSLFLSLEDNLGCTTLLTLRDSYADAEALAAGVITLAFEGSPEQLHRTLLVRKMRGMPTDLRPRRFDLAPGRGVVVEPT